MNVVNDLQPSSKRTSYFCIPLKLDDNTVAAGNGEQNELSDKQALANTACSIEGKKEVGF